RSYQLNVVQHPQKTAEFGHARLSRLPLTPPMVVQLIVRDANGNSIVPEEELPFLIAHLSLFHENGQTPLDMGSSPTGPGYRQGAPQPILYGNLVSSVDHLEDLNGNMGLFFLFPDVSIRWRGRFQLGITLVRISRRVTAMSGQFPVSLPYPHSVPVPTRLASLTRARCLRKRGAAPLMFSRITNIPPPVCTFLVSCHGGPGSCACPSSPNKTNADLSPPGCSVGGHLSTATALLRSAECSRSCNRNESPESCDDPIIIWT
ncbi:velvet factor-domain-containing protein, partial [Mycena maculata]